MKQLKVLKKEETKAFEITYAYAEYKTRHAGDLDDDLADWTNNAMQLIKSGKKGKKSGTQKNG